MTYLAQYDHLFPSMLLQMEVFHSFSCLTYTPLYTHTHTPPTSSISISSVSGHLDCFHILPILIHSASNLPQYSWLENPMDKRTRRATVHGASEDWTRLSKQACRHMEITISFACILGHCASGPAAGLHPELLLSECPTRFSCPEWLSPVV